MVYVPKKFKDGTRYYGRWAGNEKGRAEDPHRCVVEVYGTGRSMISYQCQRARGHGEKKQFCKQHAKMSTKEW